MGLLRPKCVPRLRSFLKKTTQPFVPPPLPLPGGMAFPCGLRPPRPCMLSLIQPPRYVMIYWPEGGSHKKKGGMQGTLIQELMKKLRLGRRAHGDQDVEMVSGKSVGESGSEWSGHLQEPSSEEGSALRGLPAQV